jgi:hypothetical protein
MQDFINNAFRCCSPDENDKSSYRPNQFPELNKVHNISLKSPSSFNMSEYQSPQSVNFHQRNETMIPLKNSIENLKQSITIFNMNSKREGDPIEAFRMPNPDGDTVRTHTDMQEFNYNYNMKSFVNRSGILYKHPPSKCKAE